jgi:ribosome maturation factor RimP
MVSLSGKGEIEAENCELIANDIEQILGKKAKSFSQYALETSETEIWN